MAGRLALVLVLPVLALAPVTAAARVPLERARALLERYHEEPARIDRARELLEGELARERRVETMVLLARTYFLVGDVRATTT